MKYACFCTVIFSLLTGCSSIFTVTSDPLQADVFFQLPQSLEKKPLGKTPLKLTMSELKAAVGDSLSNGDYFTVGVEKKGFIPYHLAIPATRFGTLITNIEVKMKQGDDAKQESLAKELIEHLFLAQKLALSQQFERAQIELDKILAEFPGFSRALSMRASIYFAQKNYAESLKWYDEALKSDPQMEDAVKMFARVKALQGERGPAGENPQSGAKKSPLPSNDRGPKK